MSSPCYFHAGRQDSQDGTARLQNRFDSRHRNCQNGEYPDQTGIPSLEIITRSILKAFASLVICGGQGLIG